MVRRLGLALAIVCVLLSTTRAAAQDVPAQEPRSSERTPRVPRRSAGTADAPPPSAVPAAGESGATPPAPVGVTHSSVRSHVDTDQRAIALTLDDGYDPDPRILELIEEFGVRGTAFIVGAVADSDPEFLNELVRLRWLVCSHTYGHRQLTTLDTASIREEITRGADAVARVVGYYCPYFRAPYGSVDARVAAVADELGMEIIGWDASISDSAPKGTDPELQLDIAKRYLRPGSILLGHFGGTNSYTVLRSVLTWLRESDYRVGSVYELIAGDVPALAPERAPAQPLAPSRVSVSVVLPAVSGSLDGPLSPSAFELSFDAIGAAFLGALAWRRHGRRTPNRRRIRT